MREPHVEYLKDKCFYRKLLLITVWKHRCLIKDHLSQFHSPVIEDRQYIDNLYYARRTPWVTFT